MRRYSWQIILGASLIAFSAALYVLQIHFFHTPRDTFFYLFQDIAFVPVQVLLVTLIINGLLNMREKRSRLEKLNMVIGAFFSEAGTQLLSYFSGCDPGREDIRQHLGIGSDWTDGHFSSVDRHLRKYDYGIEIRSADLAFLRGFLLDRRGFLLRLLENPNLLEHESFTELLLAVFHLLEELAAREDVSRLPDTDYAHIAGDMKRAYVLLVHQWLEFMRHLKDNYPYLFSLAIRTNPFVENASPIVRS